MSSNSVGVFTTDRDLVVRVWDSALARLTRISSADASGRPLSSVIPDLEARGLIRHFRRVLQEGVVEVLAPAFHHYLIPCPPQSPSSRFEKMRQHVSIAPLEEDGRIGGLIVTLEDVTERFDSVSSPGDSLAALDHKDWRVRRQGVEEISQRDAPEAIAALLLSVRDNHRNLGLLNSALNVLRLSNVDTHSALLEFLKGPDPDLRIQAALALGEQKEMSAIPSLMEALSDENGNVVYHAIEALGKLRAHEATEELTRIAESKDFFLAFPALEAIGNIGEPRVAPRLLPLLNDETLREPAAYALARTGDEFALEAIVGLLNMRGGPAEVVARSLAIMHDRYEARYQDGPYIAELCGRSIQATGVQNLVDALANAQTEDLRPMVLVLGWLDSPAAARLITRYLGRPEFRGEILQALVRHGSAVTDLLIDQLNSEDFEVRRSAVAALGRIRDKRATSALSARLGRDEELTIPIIGALTSIGDPSAVDALFAVIGTPDAAVRKAVVGGLNALGGSDIADRVIPLLQDPNPCVREAAVRISGYFGYAACVEPLFQLCSDADEHVRRAAIEHIPFVDDKRSGEVLRRALRQEVSTVRAAAATALADMETTEAVPCLMEALHDEDPWVRYFAARSLDRHRAMEAASSLHECATSDKFPQVRIAAFEALTKINPDLATAVADSFIASTDADLRRVAIAQRRNGHEI